MNRLVAIVAKNATDFLTALRGARWPSVGASLRWSLAICERGDGTWTLWRGDDDGDAGYGFLVGAPPGVVLIGNGETTTTTTAAPAPPQQLCRRGRWIFSYDGDVEDHEYLRANTSESRSVAHDGNSDAQRLLGFLLTKIDASRDDDDAIDDVIANAAAEISRRIGSLSFLISDGRLVYAYRFDRALSIAERSNPTGGGGNMLLIASEAMFPSEKWRALEDRTLIRAHRKLHSSSSSSSSSNDDGGTKANSRNSSAQLSFDDGRTGSEPELPFTD